MGLFNRSEMNKQKECDCGKCCNIETSEKNEAQSNGFKSNSPSSNLAIKVFGTGCKKCKTLKENVTQALLDADTQADFEYVTDIERIVEAGIMSTPALEINGTIVSSGKVLNPKDIARFL